MCNICPALVYFRPTAASYLLRLSAFLLIAAAIVDKNRSRKPRPLAPPRLASPSRMP